MIAQSLFVLLAVGLVANTHAVESRRGFRGVDPNTLSCDPRGQVHLLLPHFHDCSRFYMCVHGQEVERKCQSPTIFDFQAQVCNWNWATKCWLRDLPIDGSGDGDANWEVPEEEISTEAPFRPTLDCTRADTASTRLPYNGDCQRFWRCANSQIQSAYCSDGLYFNAQSQTCDFEANVKCETRTEDELKGEFIVFK